MENKDIIEFNRLIAEFMGFKWKSFNGKYNVFIVPDGEELKYKAFNLGGYWMPYHTSWDWLMPVVEKIESINDPHHGHFGVHISSNNCIIQGTNFRSSKIAKPPIYFSYRCSETKIQSTWLSVISFIKWHNANILKT